MITVSLSYKDVRDLWKLVHWKWSTYPGKQYEEARRILLKKLQEMGCIADQYSDRIYTTKLDYSIELENELWKRLYLMYVCGQTNIKGTYEDRAHFEVTRYTIENQLNDAQS